MVQDNFYQRYATLMSVHKCKVRSARNVGTCALHGPVPAVWPRAAPLVLGRPRRLCFQDTALGLVPPCLCSLVAGAVHFVNFVP